MDSGRVNKPFVLSETRTEYSITNPPHIFALIWHVTHTFYVFSHTTKFTRNYLFSDKKKLFRLQETRGIFNFYIGFKFSPIFFIFSE